MRLGEPFGHCVKSYNPGYVYLWRELGLLNSNFYGVPLYHDLHTLISPDIGRVIRIYASRSYTWRNGWMIWTRVCLTLLSSEAKITAVESLKRKKGLGLFVKRGARQISDRNSHLSPCWYSLAQKALLWPQRKAPNSSMHVNWAYNFQPSLSPFELIFLISGLSKQRGFWVNIPQRLGQTLGKPRFEFVLNCPAS